MVPAPPPPPSPPAPATTTSVEALRLAKALRLAMTEQQLLDARQRLTDMEELLRDLPEIFERKFQQRLQPLLDRHDRLLEDNQQLRQQLRQFTATNAEMRQLPPAEASAADPADSDLQLTSLPDKPPKRWSFLGNPRQNGRAA